MPDPVSIGAGPFLFYVFLGIDFPLLYAAGLFKNSPRETFGQRFETVFGYALGGSFLAGVQTVFGVTAVFEVVENAAFAVVFVLLITFAGFGGYYWDQQRREKIKQHEEFVERVRKMSEGENEEDRLGEQR